MRTCGCECRPQASVAMKLQPILKPACNLQLPVHNTSKLDPLLTAVASAAATQCGLGTGCCKACQAVRSATSAHLCRAVCRALHCRGRACSVVQIMSSHYLCRAGYSVNALTGAMCCRGSIAYAMAVVATLWCSRLASRLILRRLPDDQDFRDMYFLRIYPCVMVYSAFAILTVY